MPECWKCGGDGECKNEYHDGVTNPLEVGPSVLKSLLGSCPDCGSDNTEMGGKCPECGGKGYT